MVQTIPAKEIDLAQVEELFGLERDTSPDFFREWQEGLSDLDAAEAHVVEELKTDYFYLSRYDLQESVVKLVVLAPMLKLAGFYRPPFRIAGERRVELVSEDEGTLVRGRVDLLVVHERLWIVAIEAKRVQYSLEVAIPQALFYMLGNPGRQETMFGLITNGREFQFLKLARQEQPRYGLSYTLSLNREDDGERVVKILKHLGDVVTQGG